MNPPPTIAYLRRGRTKRAFGTVLDRNTQGLIKVKPSPDAWKAVWLTPQEVTAGASKAPRKPKDTPKPADPAKKRERKPKPAPLSRWKELVERVRTYEADHHPEGWPAVQMKTLSALADEIEHAYGLFANVTAHPPHGRVQTPPKE
jgi:hypothetical protein